MPPTRKIPKAAFLFLLYQDEIDFYSGAFYATPYETGTSSTALFEN